MILLMHVPAADSLRTGTLFSSNPQRRFRQETLETLAHLIVRSQVKQIVLEPRASMMHCQTKGFDGDIKHLPDVIDGIAHFNYFLNRSNETSRLKGNFSLQMHRLKGGHPQREPDPDFGEKGNLVQDGEVQVVWEEGANYGFTICNTSGEDLFPYLFYFDPDEYTIKLFYGPPGRNVAPPLTATKRTLTIGMGRELAFNFTLDPEQPSPALFKLFVTNVYVELECIEQTLSPLNPGFRKAPTPRREQLPPTWDALTVIFRMY
ncbi:hypothetical protein B0H13DRAFT_2276140 [Mycena leptocephala]|nr:hypothetical protein B0H13DRAFT_2276140 [Mycena leptocephala]